MNKSYKAIRMELWANAWCAVAASSNVREDKVCSTWADKAVQEFDKRFQADNDESRAEEK